MNQLKKYRRARRLTQLQVAEHFGLSQGAIAHYEDGRRTPDLELCRAIVRFFSEIGPVCTIDDVFPPAGETEAA